MEAVQSEAIDALQSVVGENAQLKIEAAGNGVVVSKQKTNKRWLFHPLPVGSLDKNHVAHRINKLENQFSNDTAEKDDSEEPLLISEHVTAGAAKLLREENISYLDASGNCFLQSGSLLLLVQGQKRKRPLRSDQSTRAFNTAGLKLIFALLVRKDAVNWTYRDLADLVEVSRGTVGYVMEDLTRLGYVEERAEQRHLRNREDLMDRWATGYTETLRSELSRGRFKFLPNRKATSWQNHLSNFRTTKWGGEPGADLLTGNFRPEMLTLYTREETSTVCRELEAAPDPKGSIEILDMFWDPKELEEQNELVGTTEQHVPPLLIYADLVASADPRARRIAKKIWDQYLVEQIK